MTPFKIVLQIFLLFCISFIIIILLPFARGSVIEPEINIKSRRWPIESIDTVKFSRDLAREKMHDGSFESVIEKQIKNIAATGATHVAIGTPYDDEFLPFLETWVRYARQNGLKVWFRGNFSGWEGWFEYPKISQEVHATSTENFITSHPNLFENGDIFTPCPECENGGPGDPRSTGDIKGFTDFLIKEKKISEKAFKDIRKEVQVGYFSMNADVAKVVSTPQVTSSLGSVTIDNYVKDVKTLENDINFLSSQAKGKIVLGELGAPIPDIHGDMTEAEQNQWLKENLEMIVKNHNVIGINYWTSEGGTTELWSNGKAKKAVAILTSYFEPITLPVRFINQIGQPIDNVTIEYDNKKIKTNPRGEYEIFTSGSDYKIYFSKDGYKRVSFDLIGGGLPNHIILHREKESLVFKIQKAIYQKFVGSEQEQK